MEEEDEEVGNRERKKRVKMNIIFVVTNMHTKLKYELEDVKYLW